jgi:hypothetical protein
MVFLHLNRKRRKPQKLKQGNHYGYVRAKELATRLPTGKWAGLACFFFFSDARLEAAQSGVIGGSPYYPLYAERTSSSAYPVQTIGIYRLGPFN